MSVELSGAVTTVPSSLLLASTAASGAVVSLHIRGNCSNHSTGLQLAVTCRTSGQYFNGTSEVKADMYFYLQ